MDQHHFHPGKGRSGAGYAMKWGKVGYEKMSVDGWEFGRTLSLK